MLGNLIASGLSPYEAAVKSLLKSGMEIASRSAAAASLHSLPKWLYARVPSAPFYSDPSPLGFIAPVSLCELVGIYCLVIRQIGPFEEKILTTTGIVSVCSILGHAAAGAASSSPSR